jgi:hypothetical protein
MRIVSEWPSPDDDVHVFRRRVDEAACWCLERARVEDPRGSLRQLPDPLAAVGPLHARPEAVVGELVRSRAASVGRIDPLGGRANDGRILVYLPNVDLQDGAAEVATRGFFDVHNTPGWDTWIALFEDPAAGSAQERLCLLAFIPTVLVPLVDHGVDVNPEECIVWLDGEREQRLQAWVQAGDSRPSHDRHAEGE